MQIETFTKEIPTPPPPPELRPMVRIELTHAEFLILLAKVGRCPQDEMQLYFKSHQVQFTEKEREQIPDVAYRMYCVLHDKAMSLGLAK